VNAAATPRGAFQLLTSPGPAAIAVIRLRGRLTGEFLDRHVRTRRPIVAGAGQSGPVLRGTLLDESGAPLDDILVTVHAPPPEWDLRLHLHGSPGLVRCCQELLHSAGFCQSRETTSTLWPARDLLEAEANALLPQMLTLRGVQWLSRQVRALADALRRLAASSDLAQARAQCRQIAQRHRVFAWFARPLRVAVVGPPNAGKSTLVNALAEQPVSLTGPVAGTTRDWVETPGEVAGFPVLWLDTAGLRAAGDELEAEALRRTREQVRASQAVVLVLDVTAMPVEGDIAELLGPLTPDAVALNKCDLKPADPHALRLLPIAWRPRAVNTSATGGRGLGELTRRVLASAGYDESQLAAPAAFSARQAALLRAAGQTEDVTAFRDLLAAGLGRRLDA